MLCISCKAKAICKHYDYIVNAKEITCDVTNCNVFVGEIPNKPTPYEPYPEEPIDIEQVRVERMSRDLSVDFSELSKQVRKQSIEPINEDTIPCPDCKIEQVDTEMLICSVCKKVCCSACAFVTFDLDGNIDSVMCQSCDVCFEDVDEDETIDIDTVDFTVGGDLEWPDK